MGVRGQGNEVLRDTRRNLRNLEEAVARVLKLPEGTMHITTTDLSAIL